MLELQLQVTTHRSLFLSGNSVCVEAIFSPPTLNTRASGIPVSGFLQKFLGHLGADFPLKSLEKSKEQIFENIRGRAPETFSQKLQQNQTTTEEELFHAEGNIFNLKKESNAPSSLEQSPFQYRVLSRFHGFKGKKTILHNVLSQATGEIVEIKDSLSPSIMSHLVPAELSKVRFGIEFFRPRLFSSLFGTTPTLDKWFYLDINKSKVSIFLKEASIKKECYLPLENHGILTALDATLRELDLYENFLLEANQKLSH